MDEAVTTTSATRVTSRGAATKARIVRAAADLMYFNGVNATTLDDVRAASGTSKSQLYHHFADKDALVHAVVALRGEEILARESQRLQRLNSFAGLTRWRNMLVQVNSLQRGAYGCALGSLASELSDQDEQARSTLAALFASWEGLIADGLRRMQANGSLRADADPDALATGLMAALQGGYLLAETNHDIKPMEIALDMALNQIKTYLTA
ncbi:TetR/AcrR family transcriptional regulator [Jatrophihabitans sp. DSM 45814]